MYEFDGNEMHSLGTLLLPIRANPYNVIMEFYVVGVESPHNAIFKRSWLHMMKAVPSTYHQLVRYPTPTGTTDIKGDQAATRTISAVAHKSGWKSKIAKAVFEESLLERKKLKQIATE